MLLYFCNKCMAHIFSSNLASPLYKKLFSNPLSMKYRFLYKGEAKLLENICAIHLLQKYNNTDDPQLFFYNRNVEVDFFIPHLGLAVQASYDISDTNTLEREVSALVALNKISELNHAQIVTWDNESQMVSDGLEIEIIPVWKWLLS